MKKMFIIFNIFIALATVVFVFVYTYHEEKGYKKTALEEFDNSNVVMTQVIDNYLDEAFLMVDGWDNALKNVEYTMQEAIDYLRITKVSDDIYAQIVWEDSLEGMSTVLEKDKFGNEVNCKLSYAGRKDELFSQLGTKATITPRYVNPVTGRVVVGFYKLISLKNDLGVMQNAIMIRIVPTSYIQGKCHFAMKKYDNVETNVIEVGGNYIVPSSIDIPNDNYFDYLGEKYPNVSTNELKNEMDVNMTIHSKSDKGNVYFSFYKLGKNSNWYVVSNIDENSLFKTHVNYLIPAIMISILFISIGLNISFFYLLQKSDHEIQKTLQSQIELIQKQEIILEEALTTAETANKAKSNFLANMSHDIRTPMNAIVGLTTLLARDIEEPEKIRKHITNISASSHHLLGLINDILDMSKIESGETTLSINKISLSEIVNEIDTMISAQTKEKNQSFTIKLNNVKNENVLADKVRLNQILINLLSNAVKYTPENGKIEFVINQLECNNDNFGRFSFEVIDNGIGMTEEYQKIIFEPFTREKDTLVNETQGTGLGMSITKQLVEIMGGSISVQSKKGEGSKFTVELEFQIPQETIDMEFWHSHKIYEILVISKQKETFVEIQKFMENIDVELLYGNENIETIFEEKNIDLVIYDLIEINEDIHTIKKIQKILPKNCYFICLSQNIQFDVEELGISGVLPKPFFLSNLMQKIDIISGRNSEILEEEKIKSAISNKHFLIAEDNDLNAEILRELLSMSNSTSEIAMNGQEAYTLFVNSEVGKYDAILMDVQMPVMNGYQATKEIRNSNHPQAKDIIIIAMTANTFVDDINKCIESGMNSHVAKPIDMTKLAKALYEENIKNK